MQPVDDYSKASKIVNEELGQLFIQATAQLKNDEPDLSPTEVSTEIKNALAFRFGNPVAKLYTLYKKKENRWNSYIRDNYT